MLDRVVKAIELFTPSYYVMPAYMNKYNVFKITPPGCVDECILNLKPQIEAEDECERLNNLDIARKAIEALKLDEKDWKEEYLNTDFIETFNHILENVILTD